LAIGCHLPFFQIQTVLFSSVILPPRISADAFIEQFCLEMFALGSYMGSGYLSAPDRKARVSTPAGLLLLCRFTSHASLIVLNDGLSRKILSR